MYHCIFLLYNWYYSVIKGPKTWPQCPRCCKTLRPASLLCVCVCVAHPALSQTESRLFCSETFQIWALKKVLWLSCQFVTSCVSPACDTFIISFSNVSYKSYKTVFSSLTISSDSVCLNAAEEKKLFGTSCRVSVLFVLDETWPSPAGSTVRCIALQKGCVFAPEPSLTRTRPTSATHY